MGLELERRGGDTFKRVDVGKVGRVRKEAYGTYRKGWIRKREGKERRVGMEGWVDRKSAMERQSGKEGTWRLGSF